VIEHPTGVTECVVTVDDAGQVVEAGMLRTARLLMDGKVFA
jgi:4-oxalomesaconate tautomerase